MIKNAYSYMDLFQKIPILASKAYTLDLLFTNIDNLSVQENKDIFLKLDKHHLSYNFSFKVLNNNQNCIYAKKKFYSADYNQINMALLKCDWNKIIFTNNLDSMIDKFYGLLNELIQQFVPEQLSRPKRFPAWFSQELRDIVVQKRFIHFLWKITNDIYYFIEFKRLRAICKKNARSCYMHYISQIEQNCRVNPRTFYTFVNNKSNYAALPSRMILNNNKSDNINDTINLFSEYFHSSFSNTGKTFEQLSSSEPSRIEILFSDNDILKIVSNFKDYGGFGPDGIPNVFIKNCIHSLLVPLTAIFRKSFATYSFPKQWKSSYIVPVFKKGDKKDISNYRPISILSSFSKILESLFYNSLYNESYKLFNPNQHGFIKNLSTVTNLAVYADYVSKALDHHKQVDTIYTDFSKAFDKVCHGILIDKLFKLNINNGYIHWIISYLSDRTQYVVYNNCISVPSNVLSGVPQGSRLGPLLFILYINDLSTYIKFSLLLLYADDCKLSLIINSPFDSFKLQSDLTALEKWSIDNLIPLNIPKCAVMHVHRCNSPFYYNYTVNNIFLSKVSSFKDLGIIFDDNFNYSKHIELVASKSMRNFGWIRRQTKSFRDISTIRCLFNSFVLPHLYYASNIWTPYKDKDKKKLESVNHQLIRYIAYKDSHPIHFFNHDYSLHSNYYNIHTILSQQKLLDSIMGFKLIKNSVNISTLSTPFKFRPPNSKIRIFRPLVESKASGDGYYNSFVLRLSRIINDLSAEIKINPDTVKNMSVDTFKNMVSPLLLEYYKN